jgi:hypothetical protein
MRVVQADGCLVLEAMTVEVLQHYGRIVKAFCFAFHHLTDVSPVARNKKKMGLERKFHIHRL